MDEFIVDFKVEAKKLVTDMTDILEGLEGDFSLKEGLNDYGQLVDRILGGAKSLELNSESPRNLQDIGNYAEICKLVAYSGSQISKNEGLYNIVVALLLDATEMLGEMILATDTGEEKNIKELLSTTFLERLKLINQQFDVNTRGSLEISENQSKGATQNEIDDLMKALGV